MTEEARLGPAPAVFGLLALGRNVHGTTIPYDHAVVVVLAITAVITLMYSYAFLRPRPSFAVVIAWYFFAFGTTCVAVVCA